MLIPPGVETDVRGLGFWVLGWLRGPVSIAKKLSQSLPDDMVKTIVPKPPNSVQKAMDSRLWADNAEVLRDARAAGSDGSLNGETRPMNSCSNFCWV